MTATVRHGLLLAGLVCLCGPAGAAAEEPAGPPPAEVTSLSVEPGPAVLQGRRSARQVVVTAALRGGGVRDVTREVKYDIADPKNLHITPGGRLTALADGKTTVTVRYGERSASFPVETRGCDAPAPVGFERHVVPLLSRLGCNAGACHGRPGGQNEFELSLFGADPRADYEELVKDVRGRRVFAAGPEFSLLLLKATRAVPHRGGKRLEVGSPEYELLHRWVRSGVPGPAAGGDAVTGLAVFPDRRVLPPHGRQQLAVVARFADGSELDVTRLCTYESTDPGLLGVDAGGSVSTFGFAGEGTVLVRYRGLRAGFRAAVPRDGPPPAAAFEERNVVDREAHAQWRRVGLAPSAACGDEAFLRRVTVHLTGRVPTPEEIQSFRADGGADRRDRVIDRLLSSPEYAVHFADWYADALHAPRVTNAGQQRDWVGFYQWLRDGVARDRPHSETVRELLTAKGDQGSVPQVNWYWARPGATEYAEDAARVFLGVRLECAKCHAHPSAGWTREDYWGMAALFARVQKQGRNLTLNAGGWVNNPLTGQQARPHVPGGEAIAFTGNEDPRQHLADWLQRPDNPYLARAAVNRLWGHFFGRPLVDTEVTADVTAPATNPELLDALAAEFRGHNYSLKHLIKLICQSRTYQLAAAANETNEADTRHFSRFYPQPLRPGELYTAAHQILQVKHSVPGVPAGEDTLLAAGIFREDPFRAPEFHSDLPANKDDPPACPWREPPPGAAGPGRDLELLALPALQGQVRRPGALPDKLARDPRPDRDKVGDVFLWALGRPPTDAQAAGAVRFLERQANKAEGYARLLLAVLNTREFVYVQ